MAPVTISSPEEIEEKLSKLQELLKNLPASIPYGRKFYSFDNFVPDPEKVDDFGAEGAINHALEIVFSPPQGRTDDPITYKERGEGLVAVADVLKKANKDFPCSAILQKWVDDLTKAAQAAIAVPVRNTISHTLTDTQIRISG
jgi:hypothetical protein